MNLLLHVVTPSLLLSSEAPGGALVGPVKSLGAPSASEHARLRRVQRAARDGMCTSDLEDDAIQKVGGEFAATYGEITPRGFSALAESVNLGCEDAFCDLGSGLGRLVIQAAREYGVCRSYGVEYAPSRHRLAQANLRREAEEADDADECDEPLNLASRVHLLQGDCADEALWRSDGPLAGCTVALAANLLFSAELNARLRCRLEACTTLRAVMVLHAFPEGLGGFGEPVEVCCETSWSAPLLVYQHEEGSVQPHKGTPVWVYERRCR